MEFNNNFPNNFPKPTTIDSLSNSGEPNLCEEITNNLNQKSIPNFYGNSFSEILSKKSDYSTTSSKLEEDLPLIKDLIFCHHCKKPYFIIFTDNLDLSFDCDCSLLKNLTIEEYKNEYIKLNKENLYQKSKDNSLDKDKNKYLLHCKIHPDEHQFEYYCTDCKYDLCKKCLQEYCRLDSNKNKKFKIHENHTKIKLDDIIPKIENIKNLIETLNQDLDNKKMMSIVAEDGSIEEVELVELSLGVEGLFPPHALVVALTKNNNEKRRDFFKLVFIKIPRIYR